MVATISARKSRASAEQYFTHLKQDDYYLKNEDEGLWYGRATEYLNLDNVVTREHFGLALQGRDPLTATPLIQTTKKHQPGWDITLSAPKSVSVLWALAPDEIKQQAVLDAHKKAVLSTCDHIEKTYGITRRGKGGRVKEKTAGLLFSVFSHKTSRSLCPQLHTHLFTFNLAARKDSTWGTILSKPLYNAQKEVGQHYRKELNQQLQRLQVPSRLHKETIKIDGIDRKIEMAFSIRRKQILNAMEQYGYSRTAKGFEKANLRTRQAKKSFPLEQLFKVWNERALKRGLKPDGLSNVWDGFKPITKSLTQNKSPALSRKAASHLAAASTLALKPGSLSPLQIPLVDIIRATKKIYDLVQKQHRSLSRINSVPTRKR